MKGHFALLLSLAAICQSFAGEKPLAAYLQCYSAQTNQDASRNLESCDVYIASIYQLLARPEFFHGKKVLVMGFVHLEFEGRSLFANYHDAEDNLSMNALWLGGFPKVSDFDRCQDTKAMVLGTFNAENHGHMGGWSGAIEDISECQWDPDGGHPIRSRGIQVIIPKEDDTRSLHDGE